MQIGLGKSILCNTKTHSTVAYSLVIYYSETDVTDSIQAAMFTVGLLGIMCRFTEPSLTTFTRMN